MKINLPTNWTECNPFLRSTFFIFPHTKCSNYMSSSNDNNYRTIKLRTPRIYTIGAGYVRLETDVRSASNVMDTNDRYEEGSSVQTLPFTRRIASSPARLSCDSFRHDSFIAWYSVSPWTTCSHACQKCSLHVSWKRCCSRRNKLASE